jgi:hypothetical protein
MALRWVERHFTGVGGKTTVLGSGDVAAFVFTLAAVRFYSENFGRASCVRMTSQGESMSFSVKKYERHFIKRGLAP